MPLTISPFEMMYLIEGLHDAVFIGIVVANSIRVRSVPDGAVRRP
jgi:hypothetical protein